MFWIHGGAFNAGGNFLYIPRRYMEEDVVLVEVQYRLGPLGILLLSQKTSLICYLMLKSLMVWN